MTCVHLGDRAGGLVVSCCGGREKLVDLHWCGSPLNASKYCVPTRMENGLAEVDVGSREVAFVSGCVQCPHSERKPAPEVVAEQPKSHARRLWEDLRKRRSRNIATAMPAHPAWDSMACVYRGEKISGDRYQCHLKGECSRTTDIEGLQRCDRCSSRSHEIVYPEASWPVMDAVPAPPVIPLWKKRLPIKTNPIVLNNAIIEYRGRMCMAYRNGWGGAKLRMCVLNHKYDIIENVPIEMPRSRWNSVGCEDPRLFIYQDKLHIAFTGVEPNNGIVTHVMYARLNDRFQVEQVFLPHFSGRSLWEKNWSFFEHGDRLYCEYSCNPRIILEVVDDEAKVAYADPSGHKSIGTIRGGASPHLWRNEFYCFDHRVFRHQGRKWYMIGVHTFENQPPFHLARSAELPVLVPDEHERPGAGPPSVVYPCGVVMRNNQWVVSYGNYDTWCELAAFDVNQVEKMLQPVDQTRGYYRATFREDYEKDLEFWRDVYVADEYQCEVKDCDLVVDVGAHIGAFTRRMLEKGARVVAIEAYKDSALVCQKNNPEAAVIWGSCCGQRDLSPSLCGQSFRPGVDDLEQHGDMIPLDDIVPEESIRILKLDCEGAEYSICQGSDLSRVQEIVGEAHAVEWQGRTWGMEDLTQMLEQQGFQVTSHKPGDTWLFRATRIPETPQ